MAKILSGDELEEARRAFGAKVFGPILGEFALRLWLYTRAVREPGDASLLFCARGGLRQRVIYEAFLSRTGLESPVPYSDFMVSRLVAARAGLAQASGPALDEIRREFAGQSRAKVAASLAQVELPEGPDWDLPFDSEGFDTLWASQDAQAGVMRARCAEQTALFSEHVRDVTGGRRRVILVDTGLYGSTGRMLAAAYPDYAWDAVMFARQNYKRFDTAHFAFTSGLAVQREGYSPFSPRSSILRYWQLIEFMFEPELSSVRTFSRDKSGQVRANLEETAWRHKVTYPAPGLFVGALSYFDKLDGANFGVRVLRDAPRAWRQLSQALRFPSARDVPILATTTRGQDFGRDEAVKLFHAHAAQGLGNKLKSLRHSLWREGDIALAFGLARRPVQMAVDAAQTLRGVRNMRRAE